jgi:hypothetical protein
MFVTLDGRRVEFRLGRWNSSKAIQARLSPEDSALVDLAATEGISGLAKTLGVDAQELAVRFAHARAKVAKERDVAVEDLPIVDLIDELGYTSESVSEILAIPLREVRQRYWSARRKLMGRRHSDILAESITEFCKRDFAAFELVHVLNYSIGSAAKMLGLNRGHLCRRLNALSELLRQRCQTNTP